MTSAKMVAHYKIFEKLGEGGMGVVYKALDARLDRIVAVKFLPKHIAENGDERKRFEIEARAAAALNHLNITTIHAIEEHDGELFIVMEFIEGRELREIIREGGAIALAEAIDIATQIAAGLQAAHEKGIVHRDIKSANIMVTPSGQAKIMDFGLAKIGAGAQLTKENSTLGTTAYMSPEQTRGEEVDHRTDIWSFGVVLYEMLTGTLPFKGDYEQAIMYSILNEEPESVSSINANVPSQLEEVVNQALAKNPDERFQNTNDLLVKLKVVGNRLKGTHREATVSQNIKKFKKRFPYFYAGIFVIIALTALMSIFFFPEREQEKSINIIAVLPFSNTRPDTETDYLGFALADQIIGNLAYFKNIVVRPSSSIRKYEKQVNDPIIAGNDLMVDYILTGNYLKEAETIRLNIELVDVKSNEMLWREPIEIEYKNAFKLQDMVSEKVIKGLRIQFSQDERGRGEADIPKVPLAYEYYLRSISYPSTIEGEQLAIEMLKKSIELDSSYAPAFNQLGLRTQRLAQFGLRDPKETARAEKFYLKALSLNGELLSALADLAMLYTETARIEEAVGLTKQILKINPNNASAHFSLGYIYRYAGMLDESRREMEKAVEMDPRNSKFRSLGTTYMNLGEYEKAIKAFDLDKGSPYSLGWSGHTLFRQGRREQAIKYFDRVIALEPEGLWGDVSTVLKSYAEGDFKKALNAIQKLEQANIADAEGWYYWASFYALLGDRTGCIRALQRAVEGGYFNYPFMLTDSFLDSIRGDPEFQKILQKAREKHLAFRKKFFPKKL